MRRQSKHTDCIPIQRCKIAANVLCELGRSIFASKNSFNFEGTVSIIKDVMGEHEQSPARVTGIAARILGDVICGVCAIYSIEDSAFLHNTETQQSQF